MKYCWLCSRAREPSPSLPSSSAQCERLPRVLPREALVHLDMVEAHCELEHPDALTRVVEDEREIPGVRRSEDCVHDLRSRGDVIFALRMHENREVQRRHLPQAADVRRRCDRALAGGTGDE